MTAAASWVTSRVSYVEAVGALSRVDVGARKFVSEWGFFNIVEFEATISEAAAELAAQEGLRALDAIHLASAKSVAGPGVVVATWDKRLWSVARKHGFEMLPDKL